MRKTVKLKCNILNDNFMTTCDAQSCPDLENPNRYKVTTVYNESCAFYQLGECPSPNCVLATGDDFSKFSYVDENSLS